MTNRQRFKSTDRSLDQIPLRKIFRVFLFLAVLGNLGNWFLAYSYSAAGITQAGLSVQELYIEAISEAGVATGAAGTIGQLCRIALPFALIAGVILLFKGKPAVRLVAGAIILLTLAYSYLASFSRGQALFQLACIFVTAVSLGLGFRKLAVILLIATASGIIFYVRSAGERSDALNIDENQQLLALEHLFDFESTAASNAIASSGGPQTLGLLLYFTHSLVDGGRLISRETSPMFLGGFTFFPLANPIKRAVGVDTSLDQTSLSRPNVWNSAVGDLYLDFGAWAFLLFPVLALAMARFAQRHAHEGIIGYCHYVITGVFFLLFPLYSVFHSNGLVYFVSLLAVLGASLPRRFRFASSKCQ